MNSISTAVALLLTIGAAVSIPAVSAGQMANTQRPSQYAPWVAYNAAMDQAQNQRRPVMLLFNGSDWSPEAREFTIKILATEEFADWSSRNVIKVEVDFPRYREMTVDSRRLNEQLRQKYRQQVSGFPTLLFIDVEGNVVGKLEYQPGTTREWLQRADETMRSIRLPDLVA